jgi:hypothetical protein
VSFVDFPLGRGLSFVVRRDRNVGALRTSVVALIRVSFLDVRAISAREYGVQPQQTGRAQVKTPHGTYLNALIRKAFLQLEAKSENKNFGATIALLPGLGCPRRGLEHPQDAQ